MSELAVQNEALEQEIMPSFNFLLEGESEKNALLAEHRAWLWIWKRMRMMVRKLPRRQQKNKQTDSSHRNCPLSPIIEGKG